MQDAKSFKEYKSQVREALGDDFLRTAMDNFAIAYRASRANAFKDIDDKALIKEIADAKACSTANKYGRALRSVQRRS